MAKEKTKEAAEDSQEEKKNKVFDPWDTQIRTFDELEEDKYNIHVSTGSLLLDIHFDGGFIPGLSRVYGPAELGKTGQALKWAKEWLDYWKERGKVIYIDAEGRLTATKIKNSGIHKSKYFVSKKIFKTTEKGKETDKLDIDATINASSFFLVRWNVYEDIAQKITEIINDNFRKKEKEKDHLFIIFDSLDMFITKAGLAKDYTETEKVAAAQSISTVLTKQVAPYLYDNGHHLYVISQVRANLKMNNPNSPTTKMSGGNAMIHQSSTTAEVIKPWGDFIFYNDPKKKDKVIGHYCIMKFLKTFNEKTYRIVRVPIKYGKEGGVWVEREIADISIQYELVKKSGSWFDMDESLAKIIRDEFPSADLITRWQGYDNFLTYIEENEWLWKFLFSYYKKTLVSTDIGELVDESDQSEDNAL